MLFTIIFLLLAAFAIITNGSGEEEQKERCFLTLFIDTLFDMTLHVLSSYVCKDVFGVRNYLTQSRFIT